METITAGELTWLLTYIFYKLLQIFLYAWSGEIIKQKVTINNFIIINLIIIINYTKFNCFRVKNFVTMFMELLG